MAHEALETGKNWVSQLAQQREVSESSSLTYRKCKKTYSVHNLTEVVVAVVPLLLAGSAHNTVGDGSLMILLKSTGISTKRLSNCSVIRSITFIRLCKPHPQKT